MGFRLNPKWVFSVHPHLHSASSSSSSPLKLPFAYSSTVRVAKVSFLATRLLFSSSRTEEDRNSTKGALREGICASATPCIAEHVYLEDSNPKENVNLSLRSGLFDTPDSWAAVGEEKIRSHLSCSRLQYNLLMENLFALEESFVALDSLRLERDIMLQLRRLGALELFNTCLSRSLSSSDPSDMGERATVNGGAGEVVVSSRRKSERKTLRARVTVENSDEISSSAIKSSTRWNVNRHLDVSRTKRKLKSKKKKAVIGRNEAEMSTGVKIVANLERIRKTLEEESGKAASLSCWVEAAGMNEKVLLRSLQFGWYCRDELLNSTHSLVLFLARNYRGLGIAHEDLIQAGNVGVLQGAERFDPTRGYKFSTYVQYWIRKSMSMTVSQHARGVHIPSSINRAINQIQKARKTLKTSHGIKYPNDEEIAKLTGLTLRKIQSANQCLKVVGSIDQKVGDCISAKFLELTPDVTIERPEKAVIRQSLKRDLRKLLGSLEPRERQVMILRYGLQGCRPKSLEEIGQHFSVSKEWIRRIQERAIAKLRDKDTCGDLIYYLRDS